MWNKGLPVIAQTTSTFHLLSPKENGHYCPLQIIVHPLTSVRVQLLILRSHTLHIQTILPLLIFRPKEVMFHPMMGNMLSLPLSPWFFIHPTFHPTHPLLKYQTLLSLQLPILDLLVTHLHGPLCVCPQCHNPASSHQVYHQPGPPHIS